ncbi:uncharacterized protein LY79DRAFT_584959 [Colletotrichum navitas]|uniref:Uncharacterized protein n=1 Tax=Colletotrichum navitas TaxID=681940 RepID=A0AAD8PKL2_9PEZI|nr:uncharacterized protein LY79DRAFT_584959 [Colletotrichum navitas]KAK1566169.1 hypothetical protein LY79DRAFT_584959 [Colletotrichum navitas]
MLRTALEEAKTAKSLSEEGPELRWSLSSLAKRLSWCSEQFTSCIRVETQGGAYGYGGLGGEGFPPGLNGTCGLAGTVVSSGLDDKDLLQTDSTIIHPDQVAMTLQRIEHLYYTVQLAPASNTIVTQLERLQWLDPINKDLPVWAAYQRDESSLSIVPSSVDGAKPSSIQSLQDGKKKLDGYSAQLALCFDFYGYAKTCSLCGTLKLYLETFESVKDDYTKLEKIHQEFQNMAKDQIMTESQEEAARAAAQSSVDRGNEEIQELKKRLTKSRRRIDALQNMLTPQARAVDMTIQQADQAIVSNVGSQVHVIAIGDIMIPYY